MKKRLYIAYTGGTIGMRPTADGYAPAPGSLAEQMMAMPELRHPCMPDYHIHEYASLLDSANMTPQDWIGIGRDIVAHYDEYDGFIVLHGTDTMAYTASALSFLLDGLQKPVILTGAQLSLEHVLSDGRDHILAALVLAGALDIPEVCIYFNHRLLRGNRSQKTSNDEFAAFESGNLAPLAPIAMKMPAFTLNGIGADKALSREEAIAAVLEELIREVSNVGGILKQAGTLLKSELKDIRGK